MDIITAKEMCPLDEFNEGYYQALFFILRNTNPPADFKTSLKAIIAEAKSNGQFNLDFSKLINLFEEDTNPVNGQFIRAFNEMEKEISTLDKPKSSIMNLIWIESMFPPFKNLTDFKKRVKENTNKIIDVSKT